MKKNVQLTILILVSSLLFGCDTYNKEEFKKLTQNVYDRVQAKTKIKGNFCYYLGSVNFPYTDIPPSNEDSQWDGWNKEDLANTLPLFAEIGLLTRQPVESEERLYHYDLTELGQEYLYSFFNKTPSGDTIYNNAFCYGPIKVIKVRDVSEKTYEHGRYSNNETLVSVNIDYQVVNTPEWVINNQDKLKALYGSHYVFLPNVTYPETQLYIKGKDGKLYLESWSYLLMKPSGKLLTDKE
ncbi:hypothetical protein H3S75_13435 [Gilliamella sp. B14384G15]|uniref:hypothetical protein n=1 Tax=unclassified Gilliamella TaxID=2685620 RepID=UPI0018DE07E2|nr:MULTISPECIES: hypothetical protein [unclassified Gilliamella]MBI0032236.1 hypothetical protein [Gilliamella sp. B14384G15]MBI0059524.1 hypothetical protein [Gilliamella sp. B14384G12]